MGSGPKELAAKQPPPGGKVAGTPAGVGVHRKPPVALTDGVVVEIEIEGIGTLSNPVKA